MKVLIKSPPYGLEDCYGGRLKHFGGHAGPLGLANMAAALREAGHHVKIPDAPAMEMHAANVAARVRGGGFQVAGTAQYHRVRQEVQHRLGPVHRHYSLYRHAHVPRGRFTETDTLQRLGPVQETWSGWPDSPPPRVSPGRDQEYLKKLQQYAARSYCLRPEAVWRALKRVRNLSTFNKYQLGSFTLLRIKRA